MPNAIPTLRGEYIDRDQQRRCDIVEFADGADEAALGVIVITYRSGNVARFPNAVRADADAVAEDIFQSSGGFSGILRLRNTIRLAVINLAEVESISFRKYDAEDQS